MTQPSNQKKFNFPRYWNPLWIAFALVLLCLGARTEPTGYLHSWNQITTLAGVRAIHSDFRNIFAPKDVTTLVSWEDPALPPRRDDRESRFTVFEEFPLYHTLSAIAAHFLPLTPASKFVTILFWALSLLGLCSLVRRSGCARAQSFLIAVYCSSFPLLYYGQASMSDFSMLCGLIWALVALNNYAQDTKLRWLYLAAALFAVSALFKSYAACFALLLLYTPPALKPRRWHSLLALLLACTPVLLWHSFALLGSGHQEIGSHSVQAKIDSILSTGFWNSVVKFFLQYLGQICVALVVAALALTKRTPRLDWWVTPWLCLSSAYLLLTADKVQHHNYYFLPLVPAVLQSVAQYLASTGEVLSPRYRTALIAGLVVNAALIIPSNFKALRPNYDIAECSALIQSVSARHEFIAVLSSNDRYNALHYYSGRLGFSVQEKHFPISRYINSGASLLVVAVKADVLDDYNAWLAPQLAEFQVIAQNNALKDFKGKPRSCTIYRIAPVPPVPEKRLWHLG